MKENAAKATAELLLLRSSAYACDPIGWRRCLAESLREATGSVVVLTGEVHRIWDATDATVRLFLDTGWPNPEAQGHFMRYQISGANARDPFRTALDALRGDVAVASVSGLLDFAEYVNSPVYREYMAPAGIGDMMTCITAIGDPAEELSSLLTCIRTADAPLFEDSAVSLMRYVAASLRQNVGTGLADHRHPIARLTHRRRAALEAILAGLSEGDAADFLGITHNTFHSHVKEIYSEFGVGSRPELQAMFYGKGVLYPDAFRDFDSRHNTIRREGAPMARKWREAD